MPPNTRTVPLHVTISTAAALGTGRKAIADRLGLSEQEVQSIANAHGITLRRRGHPGTPAPERLSNRVTASFSEAEFASVAAAATFAGLAPGAWLRAIGAAAATAAATAAGDAAATAAAAQGQTLRAAAEAARAGSAR